MAKSTRQEYKTFAPEVTSFSISLLLTYSDFDKVCLLHLLVIISTLKMMRFILLSEDALFVNKQQPTGRIVSGTQRLSKELDLKMRPMIAL